MKPAAPPSPTSNVPAGPSFTDDTASVPASDTLTTFDVPVP